MTRHPDDAPIRAVHFDRGTRTLRVELESGAVYDYADVPERVYDDLARAPSRNSYFRAKDGDVRRVTQSRSASRSTFTIEMDHDATRLAFQRSAEQLRNTVCPLN